MTKRQSAYGNFLPLAILIGIAFTVISFSANAKSKFFASQVSGPTAPQMQSVSLDASAIQGRIVATFINERTGYQRVYDNSEMGNRADLNLPAMDNYRIEAFYIPTNPVACTIRMEGFSNGRSLDISGRGGIAKVMGQPLSSAYRFSVDCFSGWVVSKNNFV